MATSKSPDVAVIGAGVAGGAIASALAKAGVSVALLERSEQHIDRVRGEWLAPWGVAEATTLGLLEPLLEAGGNFLTRSVGYDEICDPETAERTAIDFRQFHPNGTGPLSIGHPTICDTFDDEAIEAGAVLLRGVRDLAVQVGAQPKLAFLHDGVTHEWTPRFIIGADGRTSSVRRQLGMEMSSDEPHHFIGGMLVDGVSEWPREQQSLGTEGSLHYLIFPQRGSRLRLYVCYDSASRNKFTGPGREQNLLAAFRLKCLPLGDAVAKGVPIGPFHSASNEDQWVDDPVAPGVVLIGDAAGFNDPIIGQGLSISLRDARMVSDLILDGARAKDDFRPYVEERRERMRRLRITARFWSALHVEFGADAASRRARALRRMFVEGRLSPFMAIFAGPETLPPRAFTPENVAALLAA